jgi:hypothetical protein
MSDTSITVLPQERFYNGNITSQLKPSLHGARYWLFTDGTQGCHMMCHSLLQIMHCVSRKVADNCEVGKGMSGPIPYTHRYEERSMRPLLRDCAVLALPVDFFRPKYRYQHNACGTIDRRCHMEPFLHPFP